MSMLTFMCDVTSILPQIESGDPSAGEQLLPLEKLSQRCSGDRARIKLRHPNSPLRRATSLTLRVPRPDNVLVADRSESLAIFGHG